MFDIRPIAKGGLVARFAETPAEVALAQRLRFQCFSAAPVTSDGLDVDSFDLNAVHGLVLRQGRVVACFRMRLWQGPLVDTSYTAQFYDLSVLGSYPKPMLELGRFCVETGDRAADVLRLAWALITAAVEASGAGFLFGCTSFPGANAERHAASLALLKMRVGPAAFRPGKRSGDSIDLCNLAAPFNHAQALAGLPPLLRSYLGMGGWVSDHAVLDTNMDTLHVFTGLDVAQIPPERARVLRALAADLGGVK